MRRWATILLVAGCGGTLRAHDALRHDPAGVVPEDVDRTDDTTPTADTGSATAPIPTTPTADTGSSTGTGTGTAGTIPDACDGVPDGARCDGTDVIECVGQDEILRTSCSWGCTAGACAPPPSWCSSLPDGDHCDGSELVTCSSGVEVSRDLCTGGCTVDHCEVPVPQVLAPPDGDTVTTPDVFLDVADVPGAITYRFEIDFQTTGGSWSAYYTYDMTVSETTFWPVIADTSYRWRASVETSDGWGAPTAWQELYFSP